jgi:hypothetical protein
LIEFSLTKTELITGFGSSVTLISFFDSQETTVGELIVTL